MIDLFITLLIIHLFGVIIGAGGAYASDMMFFHTVRDGKMSRAELGFLKLGSKMVWGGLLVIVLSGLGLFLTKPDVYLASSKFQAKMTIVTVIILNGIIFHRSHLPLMHRHAETHFPSSDEFMRRRPLLLASGVISMVSWTSAIILGMLKHVPYSYTSIIAVYLGVVAIGILVGFFIKSRLLPHHRN